MYEESVDLPSFTILDRAYDNNPEAKQMRHPDRPVWESQYSSATFSSDNPVLDYRMEQMSQDYPKPVMNSSYPQVPLNYDINQINNQYINNYARQWNLQSAPPVPLPGNLPVNLVKTPYGTPYQPTFSYNDASLAVNAGVNAFQALPGVPAASWPAMQDARYSPAVPMGPSTIDVIRTASFKEGYNHAHETFTPTCGQFISHSSTCALCSHYIHGWKKLYNMGLIILLLLVVVLLFLLFRQTSIKFKTRLSQ